MVNMTKIAENKVLYKEEDYGGCVEESLASEDREAT